MDTDTDLMPIMQAKSLKSILLRKWIAFSACTAAVFAAAGILLLFLLEDAFIDRQLESAARNVSSRAPAVAELPAEIAVYRPEDVPVDIHAKLPFAEVGKPFEMRRADRSYAHVLVTESSQKEWLILVFDATDYLVVSPQLGGGLLLVLGLTGAVLIAAALMANTFVDKVTNHADSLAEMVRRSPSPDHLKQLAKGQEILEFQALLGLYIEIWEAQMGAVDRERRTMAYLAHELRTPLQSAQTSMALLVAQPENTAAFDRLKRALLRLSRASRAALWLASDRCPDLTERVEWFKVIARLEEEFVPLARRSGQSIEAEIAPGAYFHGPEEIGETILANLLLNAVQHGDAGIIKLSVTSEELVLTNPAMPANSREGFGFGLEIVRRLAARNGWVVRVVHSVNATVINLRIRDTRCVDESRG